MLHKCEGITFDRQGDRQTTAKKIILITLLLVFDNVTAFCTHTYVHLATKLFRFKLISSKIPIWTQIIYANFFERLYT